MTSGTHGTPGHGDIVYRPADYVNSRVEALDEAEYGLIDVLSYEPGTQPIEDLRDLAHDVLAALPAAGVVTPLDLILLMGRAYRTGLSDGRGHTR